MDFRIRNSYIKKFLSNYTNQNELKIIKYLVIIAIRSLEKMSKEKFTYSELKNQAKEIMKSVPKEDKQLNKELKIIKDELAKLNEKFQDKFKAPSPQKQQQQTFKEPAKQEPNYPRSTSAPRNYDPKTLTRKAPSTWREGDKMTFEEAEKERRANSNEPVPQQDWNKTRQRGHHAIPSITLKPNEIPFPRVNPRDNINHVTKHHLDDTESVNVGSKKVMNEEGVVYFPERDKENNKRLHNQTKQSQKTRTSHKAKQETRAADESKHSPAIRYSMTRDQYEEENQDEVTPRSEAGEVHKSKSPQFQSRGNLQRDLKYRQEEDYELRHPVAQDTFGPGYRGGEYREDRKAKTQKTQKPTHDKAKNRSTKLSRSRLNQTQLEPQREYGDVESKIKDDVNYHKELSRQYKKMKTNMRQYDSQMEEDLSASSSQRYSNHPEKFEFVAPKETGYRHRQSQDSSRYQSAYYNNSHLLESASSVAKSLNMQRSPNHLLERTGDYNMSATRHRRTENARNEDGSYYKSIAGENQGGILDIANSFLNSPLMQHLSNIDSRHSEDDSSKASSSQGEHSKRHVSNVRVTTFDSKSPSLFPKSPAKRYEGVDESRRLEPHSSQNLRPISHQHKYSDWVGVYKPDNVKTHQSIVLKDSDNKRYADYGSKDSRMFGDKDDTSSMTSSAFSNFLNDEMKVFFRKETYELKKNKNSKSMLRHDDSEISSNNTSFPRNEMNRTVSGGPSHSRRITNQHYYDNNKSYNGLPLDNVNIFHNERLSVTRVLNS